jgi:hypothetical protein
MIKYSRNSIIPGRLKDELVAMDSDKSRQYSFNKSATTVWDHLELPMTHDDLCEVLIAEYELDPVQCWSEVGELLKEMVGRELLAEEEE